MLIALSVICAIVGIIGAIVPGLPGPPISWAALLLLYIKNPDAYTDPTTLAVTGILAVAITVLDYVVPAWGTKKFGGSKAGTRGSTIGLIVSVFVLPILGIAIGPFGIVGILAGPFIGAYLGEKIHGSDDAQALRSAFGSFVGFLAGTFMKLAYGIVIAVMAIVALV